MLGEALEACFGVLLTIGPAIEEGFYYDCSMSGRSLTDAERPMLESKIKQVHPAIRLSGTEQAVHISTMLFGTQISVDRLHHPFMALQLTRKLNMRRAFAVASSAR